MSVKRFGDWNKMKSMLAKDPARKLRTALHRATVKNALILVRETKKGIVSQAPGGEPFAKLAESTIKRKGSSKALIDTGFLLNSITQKILSNSAFVGLLNTASGKDGDELVSIGAIMEYGATITMPNGNTVIIPPRPFLHPVLEDQRKVIRENYLQALKKAF